jgi:hypothetical protein
MLPGAGEEPDGLRNLPFHFFLPLSYHWQEEAQSQVVSSSFSLLLTTGKKKHSQVVSSSFMLAGDLGGVCAVILVHFFVKGFLR